MNNNADNSRPFIFNFIPKLRPHLLREGGRPGVEYLQVSALNLREAQDRGFSMIDGAKMYTIQGSLGSVDCQLWGRGDPIQGLPGGASVQVCHVDQFILNHTGLKPHGSLTPIEFRYTGVTPAAPAPPAVVDKLVPTAEPPKAKPPKEAQATA